MIAAEKPTPPRAPRSFRNRSGGSDFGDERGIELASRRPMEQPATQSTKVESVVRRDGRMYITDRPKKLEIRLISDRNASGQSRVTSAMLNREVPLFDYALSLAPTSSRMSVVRGRNAGS